MTRLIHTYTQRHSAPAPTLEIDNSAGIAARIADVSLDLALVECEYAHPDLLVRDWLGDEVVVICSPGHHPARYGRRAMGDRLAERWVVRETGSGTRQTLDRAMHSRSGGWCG